MRWTLDNMMLPLVDGLLDPITHHSQSTYAAFDNNPVFWADPSGAATGFGGAAVEWLGGGAGASKMGNTGSDPDEEEETNNNASTKTGGSGVFAQIGENFAKKDLSLDGSRDGGDEGGCLDPPCNGGDFWQTRVFDFDSLDDVGATTGETMLTLGNLDIRPIGGGGALELIGGVGFFKATKLLKVLLSGGKATKRTLSAFAIAKTGGKHAGFYKNYVGRSSNQINKAMNTLQMGKRGINTHLDKIASPSKYVPNWGSLRPGHQKSLINGWNAEIKNGREQINILKGILKN